MIEKKKMHVQEKNHNNEAAVNLIPDCDQSCCSPEFTEGCIECNPADS